VWRVSPMQELLKRGASKRSRSRRRTSVYSSLLCGARNRRKSSHPAPRSQHRGSGSESPRDNSSRVSFSVCHTILPWDETDWFCWFCKKIYVYIFGPWRAYCCLTNDAMCVVLFRKIILMHFLKKIGVIIAVTRELPLCFETLLNIPYFYSRPLTYDV
jgi:hypothetical protein